MRLALFLLVPASLSMYAQAQGAVAGRVFCADTRTPCRFASVVLQTAPPPRQDGDGGHVGTTPQPTAGPTHSYAATTDLDGAFRIADIAPGEYYILGELAGYVSPSDFAANVGEGDPALARQAAELSLNRVTVTADQTATANLSLARGASLAGTVQYDDGGLGIHLPYHVFRRNEKAKWQLYTNHSGNGSLASIGLGDQTDDRGRFYVPALPPGVYAVSVNLPAFASLPTSLLDRHAASVEFAGGNALLVYSGNVFRLRQAAPIEVREGEDRAGADITIPVNGLHSVSGVLTSKQDGRALAHGTVRLLDPEDKTVLREFFVGADGSFAFRYIPTGAYIVEVEPQGASGDKLPILYEIMTAPLHVEADITGLTYALTPAKRRADSPVR